MDSLGLSSLFVFLKSCSRQTEETDFGGLMSRSETFLMHCDEKTFTSLTGEDQMVLGSTPKTAGSKIFENWLRIGPEKSPIKAEAEAEFSF